LSCKSVTEILIQKKKRKSVTELFKKKKKKVRAQIAINAFVAHNLNQMDQTRVLKHSNELSEIYQISNMMHAFS
jgi:hypothetical protein